MQIWVWWFLSPFLPRSQLCSGCVGISKTKMRWGQEWGKTLGAQSLWEPFHSKWIIYDCYCCGCPNNFLFCHPLLLKHHFNCCIKIVGFGNELDLKRFSSTIFPNVGSSDLVRESSVRLSPEPFRNAESLGSTLKHSNLRKVKWAQAICAFHKLTLLGCLAGLGNISYFNSTSKCQSLHPDLQT